jgi:hypothetical protein
MIAMTAQQVCNEADVGHWSAPESAPAVKLLLFSAAQHKLKSTSSVERHAMLLACIQRKFLQFSNPDPPLSKVVGQVDASHEAGDAPEDKLQQLRKNLWSREGGSHARLLSRSRPTVNRRGTCFTCRVRMQCRHP